MAFIFTCGTHTFHSKLEGYEHVTAQCQNCGNFSARPSKRWEWFTFCFIPIIPFSLKPWKEVSCPICRFHQDIKYRPDVQNQVNAGPGQTQSQGQAHGQSQIPMQPQGWGSQPPPGQPLGQQQQKGSGPAQYG